MLFKAREGVRDTLQKMIYCSNFESGMMMREHKPVLDNMILQELDELWHKKGPNAYAYANDLKCFECGSEEYLIAINRLLHQGLVVGVAGEEAPDGSGKRLAIALNPRKTQEVNAILRPSVMNSMRDIVIQGDVIGPVGAGAKATYKDVQIINKDSGPANQSGTGYAELLKELAALRREMAAASVEDPSLAVPAAELAKAHEAAANRDEAGVLSALKAAGDKALNFATAVGERVTVTLLTDWIKRASGLP